MGMTLAFASNTRSQGKNKLGNVDSVEEVAQHNPCFAAAWQRRWRVSQTQEWLNDKVRVAFFRVEMKDA